MVSVPADQLQPGMTLAAFCRDAKARLQAAGVPDVAREIELLVGHYLKLSRAQLYLSGSRILGDHEFRRLRAAVAQRAARVPLAHILGEWEFWSLPFSVTADVLVPRPETEELVDFMLRRLRRDGEVASSAPLLLEIGVGSGIISVVAALELVDSRLVGIDISQSALQVARENIGRHGVADRISLINADVCQMPFAGEPFDAVVANLPYIDSKVIVDLAPEVRDHEPMTALDGGPGGVRYFRALARQLADVLRPGGGVFLEIGYDQAQQLVEIFSPPAYIDQHVEMDLHGLPRIFYARRAAVDGS